MDFNREKFLINYNTTLTLNENIINNKVNDCIIISNSMSEDGKYLIFMDELYDLKNKIKIGDVWENFDRLKLYFKHCYNINKNIPKQLKEHFLNDLKNSLLTESKSDLRPLKPLIKQIIIKEGWLGDLFSDAYEWTKNEIVTAAQSVSDFVKMGWEGAKDLVGNISKGEWAKALNILKNGLMYTLRTIKPALFSAIGMTLEVVISLVTFGAAIPVFKAAWLLALIVDIWDYFGGGIKNNASTFEKFFEIVLDLIGLVSAGVGAKGLKVVGGKVVKEGIKSLSKTEANFLARILNTLKTSISQGVGAITSLLKKLSSVEGLKNLVSSTLKSLKSVISFVIKNIDFVLGKLATNFAIFYGFEKGIEKGSEFLFGDEEEDGTDENIFAGLDPNTMEIEDIEW